MGRRFHQRGKESDVKEKLTPKQKEIAVKTAMAMHLDAFFRTADCKVESVRYYEKEDVFRLRLKKGSQQA